MEGRRAARSSRRTPTTTFVGLGKGWELYESFLTDAKCKAYHPTAPAPTPRKPKTFVTALCDFKTLAKSIFHKFSSNCT